MMISCLEAVEELYSKVIMPFNADAFLTGGCGRMSYLEAIDE
jgi:hypothetical protein